METQIVCHPTAEDLAQKMRRQKNGYLSLPASIWTPGMIAAPGALNRRDKGWFLETWGQYPSVEDRVFKTQSLAKLALADALLGVEVE